MQQSILLAAAMCCNRDSYTPLARVGCQRLVIRSLYFLRLDLDSEARLDCREEPMSPPY